jgi:hypothetical protein
VGVPQSVGQDFSAADKGRKFAKGGDTMATKGVNPFAQFKKSGKDAGAKGKEGAVKKMAAGGMFRSSANGIAQRGKTKGKQVKMAGGGNC